MKKINFYLGALAVASTALLSSCFSSDGGDDTPEAPKVDVVEVVTPCTVVPTANVTDVTFKTEGSTVKGQTITVTATAPEGKYTQDKIVKTITIGDEATIEVPFTFTLKPVAVDAEANIGESDDALTVYQGKSTDETASTTTTEVSEAAKDIELVEDTKIEQVAMEIPKEAVAEAKTSSVAKTAEFSIVVVPANDTIKQIPVTEIENKAAETAKDDAEVATLQAVCEPTGAQFTKPVKITISAPESAGLDFYAENGDSKVDGASTDNTLTIEVPHFSAWDYVLRAKVVNVQERQTYETKTTSVAAGANTINYTSKLGWSVNKKNVLVNAYLVGLLGSSRTVDVAKQVNFQSTGNGRVTYRVYAKTIEFDVVSGSATFHVVANAGSTVEITNVEYDGHSGGNAQ